MKRSIKTAILVVVIICVAIFGISVAVGAATSLMPPPENIEFTNTNEGVSVSWEKEENADGYYIFRQLSDSRKKEKIGDIKGDKEPVFLDKNVKSGETYKYFVKVYVGKKKGKASEKVEFTYLSEPTIKKAESSDGCVLVEWEEVKGAEGYIVYRKEGKKLKELQNIKGGKAVTYQDKNVDENESYNYTVVAYKGDVVSSHSFKESNIYLKMPKLTKVYNSYDGVTLEWSKTPTAKNYIIYRKTNGQAKWEKLATVNKSVLKFKDVKTESGNTYTYTVRGKNKNFYSGFDKKGLSVLYLGVPHNPKATYSNGEVVVSWSSVKGADQYKIYKKVQGAGKWEALGEISETKFVDKNIKEDKVYKYSVKAVDSKGNESVFVDDWVSYSKLGSVEGFSAMNTDDGVLLSWNKKDNASGYKIYKKQNEKDDWKEIRKVSSGNILSAVDSEVSNKKTYIYNIKPYSNNSEGGFAESVSIKFVATPGLKTRLSPKGIKLSWNETEKCESYKLLRKADGEKAFKEIATVKGNVFNYVDSKAFYGKRNNYKLTMVFEDGKTADAAVSSIFGVDPNKPMVALTYDDGPYTGPTNRILSTLEKYNSRATFFIVGERLSAYSSSLKREVALGCEIGNHTYNHKSYSSSSVAEMQDQLRRTNEKVRAITGYTPKLARAPGGDIPQNKKAYVGMPLIQWSVDTLDWKSRNASSVISNVKNNVKDGSIVLMHDLYDSTAAASEEVIPWLVKKGYQLVTVSEMMDAKGKTMNAGEVYYSGN